MLLAARRGQSPIAPVSGCVCSYGELQLAAAAWCSKNKSQCPAVFKKQRSVTCATLRETECSPWPPRSPKTLSKCTAAMKSGSDKEGGLPPCLRASRRCRNCGPLLPQQTEHRHAFPCQYCDQSLPTLNRARPSSSFASTPLPSALNRARPSSSFASTPLPSAFGASAFGA